ncbi:Putative ribonuclease H protein At1g65750 [Linum perenne]
MQPSNATLGTNILTWGLEGNGRCSVNSGYLFLKESAGGSYGEQQIWKSVWNWNGPNKLRHFIWLVSHGKILTNKERQRRYLAVVSKCPYCDREDSLHHLFSECSIALEVWREVLALGQIPNMVAEPYEEWSKSNIIDPENGMKFEILCWLLLQNRNLCVFEGTVQRRDSILAKLHFWSDTVKTGLAAAEEVQQLTSTRRKVRHIWWEPALEPWVTLNTDGSVLNTGSLATIGGVLRNSAGNPLFAFACNFGV